MIVATFISIVLFTRISILLLKKMSIKRPCGLFYYSTISVILLFAKNPSNGPNVAIRIEAMLKKQNTMNPQPEMYSPNVAIINAPQDDQIISGDATVPTPSSV